MWPFRKKAEVPKVIEPRPCQHKYKDFPWYVEGKYDYNTCLETIHVIEPYVCILCGHRKDVILDTVSRYYSQFEDAEKFYENFRNNVAYAEKIKPRAIVEDMINDMSLVDQKYLDIYMQLHEERFKENE